MAIDRGSSEERWAERRRRRGGRSLPIGRDLARPFLVALVAGGVAGVVQHVLDSAPEALEFAAVALRFLIGFGLFAGLLVGLARAAKQSRPALLLGTAAFGLAALAGYPLGPAWIPAETVGGTYSIAFQGTTVPVASGALHCDWLPGRWRVGGFEATAPVAGPGGERILLVASFTAPQVGIVRTGLDGAPRAPYVDASASVLEPPVLDTGVPQRTEDGRSGTTVATLHIDTSSPPAGAPAQWSAPLAVDGVAGVSMQVTWSCDAP